MNTPLSKIAFSVLFVAVTASASAKAFAFPAQPGYFALDMECNSQYTPRNDLSTCVDEYSHSFKIYGMGTPSDFIPIGIEATGLVHLAFVQDSTSQQRCQQQQQQQQQYGQWFEPTRTMYFLKGIGDHGINQEQLLAGLSNSAPKELFNSSSINSLKDCRIVRAHNLLTNQQEQLQQQQQH